MAVTCLCGVPVTLAVLLRDAGTATAAGVVISSVPVVGSLVALLWKYRQAILSWLLSAWDVRSAAPRIHDPAGRFAGLGIAIGRRHVLVMAKRPGAPSPADAEVGLEFRVGGRRITRTGHPCSRVQPPGNTATLAVIALTEPIPWRVPPVSLGHRSVGSHVAVLYLDLTGDIRLNQITAENRHVDLTVLAADPRAGSYLLQPLRGRVLGVVTGGSPPPVTSPAGTVTDPVVVDDLPGPDPLPGDLRSRRAPVLAALAAATAAVVGVIVWITAPTAPTAPTPPALPALPELRVAGWRDYVVSPVLQKYYDRHGFRVDSDFTSSSEILSQVRSQVYAAYTVSNDISLSLLLQEMDRWGIRRHQHSLFRESMVIGTYQAVLTALNDDPRHRLVTRGQDGVLRLNTRALFASLAAHGSTDPGVRTRDLLHWGDIPGFPGNWDPAAEVGVLAASPCEAGGGVILTGMALRDLSRGTADPSTLATRVTTAVKAVYDDTPLLHTQELAQAWASSEKPPNSPFTLIYENAALTALAQNPQGADVAGLGERVLLYLDPDTVVTQYLVVADTGPGKALLDLLTGDSKESQEIRAIQAGRFGLRFSDEAARRSRRSYLDDHHLGAAITAGGPNADHGTQAAAALPNTGQVQSFLQARCTARSAPRPTSPQPSAVSAPAS